MVRDPLEELGRAVSGKGGDRWSVLAVHGQAIRLAIGATPRERLAWLLDFAYVDLRAKTPLARFGLFEVLSDFVSLVTSGRWLVKRPDPTIRGAISSRDLPATRAKAPAQWRPVLDAARRSGRRDFRVQLANPGDPSAVLRAAQAALREAVETVASPPGATPGTGGGAYIRAAAEPARDYGPEATPFRVRPTVNASVALHCLPDRGRFTVREGFSAPLPDAIVAAAFVLLAATPVSLVRRCPYENGALCGRVFIGSKSQRWCSEHRHAKRAEQLREAQAAHRRRNKGARKTRRPR